ncbi:MAG: PEP/pyruvate-binding domain-containing protein, partial [Thermodesulfobacteriota bacterium]
MMLEKIKKTIFRKPQKEKPSRDRLALLFRYKYSSFKMLLDSNAQFLKVITDIEEILRGRQIFGISFVKDQADRAVFHVLRMIKNLDDLSNHRYGALFPVLEGIKEKIQIELGHKKSLPLTDLTLRYDQCNKEMVDGVGGKSANLGEIRSRLGIPIPEGFAVTTLAFETFLGSNNLFENINARKMEIDPYDPDSIRRASEDIQERILSARVPLEVEEGLKGAFRRMVERMGRSGSSETTPGIAMRSSAVGEDSELSFAGQYLSVLNVTADRLVETYRQVAASLYTPRAMAYRLNKGIRDEDIAMGVACLQMIDSVASGVIYTHHPLNPLEDQITITAVWGLGPYAVEGRITPDSYTVAKDGFFTNLVTAISHKPVQLVNDPQGGVGEVPVPLENQDIPCLSPEQVSRLAEYALRLEGHFQGPQDIEWALDQKGNLMILQARPLQVRSPETGSRPIPLIPDYPLLIEEGAVAFPGIGSGPAVHIRSEEDLIRFPEGGVLVARHSSPQYVMVMKRARAIVTDMGSATGHMASLAREFGVPTILDAKEATALIPEGEEITVDAYSGRVYQGRVEPLLAFQKTVQSPMTDTPVYQTLRRVADWIVPLHLLDPKAPSFAPEHCRTLHDIGRLVHERSYTEMFQLSDLVSGKEGFAFKLEARIPLDLHVIDLGEGLLTSKAEEVLKKVRVEHVASLPFKALLRGMTHEAFQNPQVRPVSLGGFLSVMREQMLAPPQAGNERFGERSYAIISDNYLNFSSRVGYHYSVLDAYCGSETNMNYITFSFKGGAADDTR